MVPNSDVQAAIVAKLKANSPLITWLTDRNAADEVREVDYQGAAFVYPNVRVGVGTNTPSGEQVNGCATAFSDVTITVTSLTEDDSSRNCDILAGLVDDTLLGKRLSGSGFRSLVIQGDGVVHAIRTAERVWQATGFYRARIYETS